MMTLSTTSPSDRIGDDKDPGLAKSRKSILVVSTLGFTLLFAVWLMFGVLAIPIRGEFKLSDVQFSWLAAIAVLNGSIWRLSFGMLADRVGGRIVTSLLLFFCAIPAFLVAFAHSYPELLLCAFLVGLAGNGFSIGIAWNSAWFPQKAQGTVLGIFGAGNVGASITKLIGPSMIVLVPAAGFYFAGVHFPGGWRSVPLLYSVLLILAGVGTLLCTPARDRTPGKGRPFAERIKPLAKIRVWRFSLYYVVMFGAYVALSLWLPKYYKDVYRLPLHSAALLTTLFIFPASLLRPLGGYLSDRFGPRRVMYWVFSLITPAAFALSLPAFDFKFSASGRVIHFETGVVFFTLLIVLLGMGMGVGKAAVYKYIPEYFPKDVGAVGGLVGALGGLGGFFLPLMFGYSEAATHIPQVTFAVLFLVIAASFIWMHLTVLSMNRKSQPVAASFDLDAAVV